MSNTPANAPPELTAGMPMLRECDGAGPNPGGVAGAASTAAIAALEVSKAVRMKGVEAPDGDSSFVALDQERRGQVDEDGLPVVYDKDLIEKYWYASYASCTPPPSHSREYIVGFGGLRLVGSVQRTEATQRGFLLRMPWGQRVPTTRLLSRESRNTPRR